VHSVGYNAVAANTGLASFIISYSCCCLTKLRSLAKFYKNSNL